MYTPLAFMEQIEHMIKIVGASQYNNISNEKCIKFFDAVIESGRAEAFAGWAWAWNIYRHNMQTDEDIDFFHTFASEFMLQTGILAGEPIDMYHQSLMYLIHHDWSRAKRVYKIESSLLEDLCNTRPPKKIPLDVLTKLPSKCFYIDLDGSSPFISDSRGFFVTWDYVDGLYTAFLTSPVEHKRLIPINSLLMMKTGETETDTYLDRYAESVDLVIEDNSKVTVMEADEIRFFYNFCMYLNTANKDVEYTERTRQVYQPPANNSKPKNRIREVEEFGVGYKYSTSVETGKVRVHYVGTKTKRDPNAPKRAYSSNWRSAHWHSYWINDPDVPGAKKLISKWQKETFVKGNISDDRVVIHKVKKGRK